MRAKFSSITSWYRCRCASSSSSHSLREKYTNTSSKVTPGWRGGGSGPGASVRGAPSGSPRPRAPRPSRSARAPQPRALARAPERPSPAPRSSRRLPAGPRARAAASRCVAAATPRPTSGGEARAAGCAARRGRSPGRSERERADEPASAPRCLPAAAQGLLGDDGATFRKPLGRHAGSAARGPLGSVVHVRDAVHSEKCSSVADPVTHAPRPRSSPHPAGRFHDDESPASLDLVRKNQVWSSP